MFYTLRSTLRARSLRSTSIFRRLSTVQQLLSCLAQSSTAFDSYWPCLLWSSSFTSTIVSLLPKRIQIGPIIPPLNSASSRTSIYTSFGSSFFFRGDSSACGHSLMALTLQKICFDAFLITRRHWPSGVPGIEVTIAGSHDIYLYPWEEPTRASATVSLAP